MARFVLIAAALAGCYGPHVADCAYSCAATSECPSTQTCDVTVGACRSPGATGACGSITPGSDGDSGVPVIDFIPSNYTASDLGPLDAFTVESSVTLNTDMPSTGTVLASGALLVHLGSFDLPAHAELKINGSRPVIFAVEGVASIEGLITVSIAGHDCMGVTVGVGNVCSGGGAGGSWGNRGGDGGSCSDGKGALANPPMPTQLVPLVGGCNGDAPPNADPMGGLVGPGGGALEISAAGALFVASGAQIRAPGLGGGAGIVFGPAGLGGGGGGGAGGSVLLEGRVVSIDLQAVLCAEGGGGGGGAFNNGATSPGGPGSPGCTATNDGAGGSSHPFGDGLGGAGATGADASGHAGSNVSSADAGGGGGGGGAGIIVLRAHDLKGAEDALISPRPTVVRF